MKVCVVGAGAIGGYMAIRIASVGHEVSVVARGPHLAAIKANGMKLIEGDRETIAGPKRNRQHQRLVSAGSRADGTQGPSNRTNCR